MDRVLKPVPGLVAVRSARWDRVESEGTRLLVHFTSEPVWQVDRIEVAEAADAVEVTLHLGVAPAQGPVVAHQLAEQRTAEVPLTSRLGGRRVVDGAPEAGVLP